MNTLPPDFCIRPATPDDAESMVAHVNAMCLEASRWLPMLPGEFQMTVDDERALLTKVAESDNSLFLLALVGGKIVGILNYMGGKRHAMKHAATLGISVRSAWQNHGIGRKLIVEAIRIAKASGCVRRLDLLVYADNERAIHLYKQLGFIKEGTRHKAILRNGELIDEIEMAMLW